MGFWGFGYSPDAADDRGSDSPEDHNDFPARRYGWFGLLGAPQRHGRNYALHLVDRLGQQRSGRVDAQFDRPAQRHPHDGQRQLGYHFQGAGAGLFKDGADSNGDAELADCPRPAGDYDQRAQVGSGGNGIFRVAGLDGRDG